MKNRNCKRMDRIGAVCAMSFMLSVALAGCDKVLDFEEGRYVEENGELVMYFDKPVVETATPDVQSTDATAGGNVTFDGNQPVTARGVCWSASHSPTIADSHTEDGAGTGRFSSSIIGLAPNSTYYVRAYATNSMGTAYGNEVGFTTSAFTCGRSTITDIDGNIYNTVQIGNQCWMKENLRTTHYADNTGIPAGNTTSGTDPYRYAPNNDESNVPTYGYLYNWPAMMRGADASSANPSGIQGICPTGWHVPSRAEWEQLISYVSSTNSNVGKALAATTGWNTSTNDNAVGNDQSANNATGFSALPAGCYGGNFGTTAYIWTTTEHYANYVYYINITCGLGGVVLGYSAYISSGFSVRCLRD